MSALERIVYAVMAGICLAVVVLVFKDFHLSPLFVGIGVLLVVTTLKGKMPAALEKGLIIVGLVVMFFTAIVIGGDRVYFMEVANSSESVDVAHGVVSWPESPATRITYVEDWYGDGSTSRLGVQDTRNLLNNSYTYFIHWDDGAIAFIEECRWKFGGQSCVLHNELPGILSGVTYERGEEKSYILQKANEKLRFAREHT